MAEQIEVDSDTLLDILGNDTRRKILTALSDEPMYFNQLAKELGVGQQAVLRHLQTLEESGLIETYAEKSDLGAPDRKYYRLNDSFILTVSL
ncbi:MAG: transcriptional regulator, partial [Nitrososphaera sp.]|nr:transcriptional regulator [Nitrososphaera sp.]